MTAMSSVTVTVTVTSPVTRVVKLSPAERPLVNSLISLSSLHTL